MNRKERKAKGIRGKKGEHEVIQKALDLSRELGNKGQHEEAIKLKRQILALDPDNIPSLLDLGLDCYNKEDYAGAEAYYSKALRLEPRNGDALTLMATLRMEQGRRDEALKCAERAAINLSSSPAALTLLGDFYRENGQMDKALENVEKALKLQPNCIPALYSRQTLKKFSAEEIAHLEEIGQNTQITLKNKIRIEFTLGRALMDVGEVDKAFGHYFEANLLKRATYKYDVDLFDKYVDYTIEIFDEAAVKRLRGLSHITSERPIFIVGMPRSGSTLVDQILSSHPAVKSVGESKFVGMSIPHYPNERVPQYFKEKAVNCSKQLMDSLNAETLDAIGNLYLELTEPYAKGAERVVDKMLFNFAWVGLLRMVFPNCKIVHCTRDPVDIGLSIFQLLFNADMAWAYDQKDTARYYLAYKRLMAHWNKLLPGEIFEANYETMVADQENQSRKLLEFCGLPWDDRVLKFHEADRQVKTASVMQVRKPIYKDSVKKWKKYEKYLQPLIQTLEKGGALEG